MDWKIAVSESTLLPDSCFRGGSGWILGKSFSLKSGDALAQTAQGGGGVSLPGDVQELWRCGTEGCGLAGMVGMDWWLNLMILVVFCNLYESEGGMAPRDTTVSVSAVPAARWWTKLCAVTFGLLGTNVFQFGEVERFQKLTASSFSRYIWKGCNVQNIEVLQRLLLWKELIIFDHIQSICCYKSQAVQRTRLCSQLLLICLFL